MKFNKVDGNIFVCISSDNEYVNISIKDTGIGIPKDEIETLFDRFKIINNRFTKVNEGSGIGLFIVKELVDIHKGKITVKSDLGEGTEFIVSLPLTKIEEDFYEEIAVTYYNNKKDRFKIELSDIYTI
nr:ATP-binding protein [Clostridium sp.]